MTPFAIAGLQLNVYADRPNIDHIQGKVDVLMHLFPWVQMVVISELATHGPLLAHAQPFPNAMEARYQQIAAHHKIWLIPGSMFERRGDAVLNTASVISPDGEVVTRYSKMFPFMPYEAGVAAGNEFVIWSVPDVGTFGLSICYDMWFPETTRTLAARGAEVIIHPTMTGTIDRDVEHSIARATAACNQCFVIDINGSADGGTGRSMFVGPLGDVLYQAGHGEEMIPIEIDLDRVRRSREVGLRGLGQPLKSFRDRKVDFTIYQNTPENRHYLDTLGPLEKAVRGSRAGLQPRAAINNPSPVTDVAPIAAPVPPPLPAGDQPAASLPPEAAV